MNSKAATHIMVEELIGTIHGDKSSLREKHVLREALRALVRLAKAEKMLEIKQDIKKANVLEFYNNSFEYWKIR